MLGDHVLLVVHRQDALHVLLPGQTDMEAVILDLLLQPPGQLTVFRGLAVLAYGALAALILLGWGCGWGADALRRRFARRKEKTE